MLHIIRTGKYWEKKLKKQKTKNKKHKTKKQNNTKRKVLGETRGTEKLPKETIRC